MVDTTVKVDQDAVSRLISALQLLKDSDGQSSGGYEKAWGNDIIDRFVTSHRWASSTHAQPL